ncbi:hypothetical protein D1AOALGA4SA_11042 [Olavius algarvensis Delta 1 endosymbiont]|nr:hypothetical protein D1AOALGA4SA_11042 [Olavius algarvensis Delta 1 endosymbiont]
MGAIRYRLLVNSWRGMVSYLTLNKEADYKKSDHQFQITNNK